VKSVELVTAFVTRGAAERDAMQPRGLHVKIESATAADARTMVFISDINTTHPSLIALSNLIRT
jgi:hypothetical protein